MIHTLPQELIDKIAAGEVVERPNSVVKELMENSIDAGSTEINVEIDTDKIVVSDNGSGISPEDMKKLFVNHSTSKITSSDDLFNIITLGFRGEALATISSVSEIEIKSKTKDAKTGYSIKPGSIPKTTSMNDGTIVSVLNLFYNVPARKKFLKSEAQENKYIIDTFTRIALAHPEVGFKLNVKDKVIYNLLAGTLEKRVKDVIPNVKFFQLINDDVITGFISKPTESYSKPTYQYMFVNGRHVSPSPAHSKAVFTGYKNALMRGQYPPYVIFINVRPDEVDVNVHPRKTEVKFENDGYIFQKIYSVIQHTLFTEEKNDISKLDLEVNIEENSPENFAVNYSKPKEVHEDFIFKEQPLFSGNSGSKYVTSQALKFSSEILKDQTDILEKIDLSSAAQYISSYIVTQSSEGIVIFDQHACSERFVFEKLMKKLENESISSKRLLIPEEVPDLYQDLIYEKEDLLKSFGLTIEKKDNKVFITGIPEFSNLRIVNRLYDELQNIFDGELTNISELREKMITTLACHSAIRFGDKLSKEECQRIITDLQTCKNKMTCPHGRPTHYILNKEKLVQIFKR